MTEKTRLRRESLARREAEPDRAGKSVRIIDRVRALPEYAAARILSAFVGVGSEVTTLPLLEAALAAGKQVAVPWVDGDDLHLFALSGLDDLAPAPFGLLEPRLDRRHSAARVVKPSDVDLFVVPGLAFDRAGGRLGHGRGYYDRLLSRAAGRASFSAVAFECQLIPEVPMSANDVRVHRVVTEAATHEARYRRLPQR